LWHGVRAPCRKALPFLHSSYGLMGQTKTLLPSSVVPITTGLCRLLPVPAGRWPFPTLSSQAFLKVPGPIPRWVSVVHSPVTSHRNIGLPRISSGSASPQLPAQRFQCGANISGLQSFLYVQAPRFVRLSDRSYHSIKYHWAASGFYFQASHGLLPPHALDMLTARIGQLTVGDFHPIRLATLSAAPLTPLRCVDILRAKAVRLKPEWGCSGWIPS
jgi:hypothetical protein